MPINFILKFFATSSLLILPGLSSAIAVEHLSDPRKLTPEQEARAAENYKKYCTLCHGENREGYANDNAPSLRSRSLFESGIPHAVLRPIQYGRHGTPMAGYLDEVGGPMSLDETWDLTYWLFWQSGVKRVRLSTNPVEGDVTAGEKTYQQNCATCHGKEGEGVNAPALGNPSALAHNTDEVIRYAITHGRNDTPMIAWKDKLSSEEIDNVTAFIRSKASGWTDQKPVLHDIPTREEYVINPDGEDPEFELSDDLYVSSDDLFKALQEKKKMIIFDTRATSVWQVAHIEGSFPLPYYSDFADYEDEFPKDVQIVAYCSCPRAAADYVVNKLRRYGYTKSAVLYEGIFGWQYLGYPVLRRDIKTD